MRRLFCNLPGFFASQKLLFRPHQQFYPTYLTYCTNTSFERKEHSPPKPPHIHPKQTHTPKKPHLQIPNHIIDAINSNNITLCESLLSQLQAQPPLNYIDLPLETINTLVLSLSKFNTKFFEQFLDYYYIPVLKHQSKISHFFSSECLEVIMNTLFTLNNSSRAIKEILLEFSYRKDFLCSLTQEKLCDWQLKCAKANISIDILLEYASLSENIDLQLAIKTGIQTICTTHEGNEDEIEFIFKKWKSKAPEYKYNIWNDYLISHTNRENYSKAEAIVEEMSAKKIRIHSTPLRKILTYYSKLPSNQKVRHILEKHGKSLSKGSTNEILFNLCCHSNLPEQAFELFDLNKSCTKQQVQQDDSLFYVSFNHITLLINSAIRSNNIQIAEQVLNNYSADSPTFLSIRLLSLQILVIKRDFNALLESKLQYSGPQASVPELLQFYLAYASALCCSNYTNETAPLVASFYEEISHVLFDENRVKEYDDINNAYQNRLTKLANEIRVTMIKLLHQHNQFASAFAILSFCSSNSISVPQDSCLKLLNTFIEQHNLLCVHGVFEYIKIHHAHSSEAYHAVLRYYYRVNRYPECQKILELMNTMGIPVNSTCRPILRSFNLV